MIKTDTYIERRPNNVNKFRQHSLGLGDRSLFIILEAWKHIPSQMGIKDSPSQLSVTLSNIRTKLSILCPMRINFQKGYIVRNMCVGGRHYCSWRIDDILLDILLLFPVLQFLTMQQEQRLDYVLCPGCATFGIRTNENVTGI